MPSQHATAARPSRLGAALPADGPPLLEGADAARFRIRDELTDDAERLRDAAIGLAEKAALYRTLDLLAEQRVLGSQRVDRPPQTSALHTVPLGDEATN